MTSEELAAMCELHDGNLASALAELEGAQEGLLVLDEALDALSKGLVEALVDRALDVRARRRSSAHRARAFPQDRGEGRLHNRDAVRETSLRAGDMCKGRSGVLDGFQGDWRAGDIERRSFEIITEELGGRTFPPLKSPS